MTPVFDAPSLSTVFPLVFLAGMSLMLLLLGVARKTEDFRTVNNFAIFSLLAVAAVVARFSDSRLEGMNGLFVSDRSHRLPVTPSLPSRRR